LLLSFSKIPPLFYCGSSSVIYKQEEERVTLPLSWRSVRWAMGDACRGWWLRRGSPVFFPSWWQGMCGYG
jgi:hypothetical protein